MPALSDAGLFGTTINVRSCPYRGVARTGVAFALENDARSVAAEAWLSRARGAAAQSWCARSKMPFDNSPNKL